MKRLRPFFGAIMPAAIRPSDVRRYVAELVVRGEVSAKTINNSLAVLRVLFAHLEEDGDVVRNPARSSRGARERIKLPAAHARWTDASDAADGTSLFPRLFPRAPSDRRDSD